MVDATSPRCPPHFPPFIRSQSPADPAEPSASMDRTVVDCVYVTSEPLSDRAGSRHFDHDQRKNGAVVNHLGSDHNSVFTGDGAYTDRGSESSFAALSGHDCHHCSDVHGGGGRNEELAAIARTNCGGSRSHCAPSASDNGVLHAAPTAGGYRITQSHVHELPVSPGSDATSTHSERATGSVGGVASGSPAGTSRFPSAVSGQLRGGASHDFLPQIRSADTHLHSGYEGIRGNMGANVQGPVLELQLVHGDDAGPVSGRHPEGGTAPHTAGSNCSGESSSRGTQEGEIVPKEAGYNSPGRRQGEIYETSGGINDVASPWQATGTHLVPSWCGELGLMHVSRSKPVHANYERLPNPDWPLASQRRI
jgi:hypothetical protein